MTRFQISGASLCFLAILCSRAQSQAPAQPPAADHASVLAPFVNDDTLAVIHIDVASIKVSENAGELVSLLPKLSGDAQVWMLGAMMVDGLVQRFQHAGGQSLYALGGLGDIYIGGGPLVVATARPGKHPEEVEQMFRDVIHEIVNDSSQAAQRPFFQQIDVQRKGDAVLIGTKSTVARYGRFQPAARNDLLAPLARLSGEGAIVAAVFCPGADYRRVSRELWPELPGPLAPLRGELADRWLHFAAAINAPPNPKPRIVLQAKDPESAAIFVKLFRDLPSALGSIKEFGTPPPQVKQALQTIVDLLPPQQDNATVTMTLSMDKSQRERLQQLFLGTTKKARESVQQKHRINLFKQLALAMFYYESEHKTFPPAAIRDKDGKPLLSWRVAILPHIDENDLYKQFHLDEPWDSPHNRTLIEKMPKLFADPDPQLKKLAEAGKTTYQVPVGPETVFYKNDGTRIREIVDGTSQTILLVEVEPSRAVIWTKPEDWQVDLSHPLQGVQRNDRRSFVAAWCDGSVQSVPTDKDEKKLRSRLTRAGHETITW